MVDEVKKIVKELIIKDASRNVEEKDVTDSALLIEDLSYNSISIISLIVDIEDYFSLHFDDAYLLIENINKVESLVSYVCKLIKERDDESKFN